jgi:hypothetical protein
VIDACDQDCKEVDESTSDYLKLLADLEKLIGTNASLLLFCLITFVHNLDLVLLWGSIVYKKYKQDKLTK